MRNITYYLMNIEYTYKVAARSEERNMKIKTIEFRGIIPLPRVLVVPLIQREYIIKSKRTRQLTYKYKMVLFVSFINLLC